MNRALGNEGSTVEMRGGYESKAGSLEDLARALQAGQVKTLVIGGGNPAYTAPADLDWPAAQRKAGSVIRLGYHEDETAALSDWHLPAAHYLESWGDARTGDGTLVPIQPLIAPLFGGLTELEFLARLAGFDQVSPYEMVRQTFRGLVNEPDAEVQWQKFLRDGFLAGSAGGHSNAALNWPKIVEVVRAYVIHSEQAAASRPAESLLEVVFHRDHSLDDGRYNNNGWLQEMPDPITKLTWENVLTISPKTARDLGVYFEDPEREKLLVPLVKVELDGRTVEAPVWVQPGQADNTIGLALGYGRSRTGRVGQRSGYNAYRLRSSAALHFAGGARLLPLGRTASARHHTGPLGDGRPTHRARGQSGAVPPASGLRSSTWIWTSTSRKTASIYPHPHAKDPSMKGIASVGHDHGLECVRGLLGLRGGLPEREQHPDRGQGSGGARPGDALDPGGPLLQRWTAGCRTWRPRRCCTSPCSASIARMRRANTFVR